MSKEGKGTVAQVQGPVIDVQFPQGELPSIQDALWLEADGRKRMMEVAQHVGRDTVRCFMLSPSEGIGRGMEVYRTTWVRGGVLVFREAGSAEEAD